MTRKVPKRLLLFQQFDVGNKIDDHIIYTLKSFYKEKIDIIFISLSPLDNIEEEKINNLVIEIYELPNQGFDWTAWKTVILNKGKTYFDKYDEIILMNDTCYGPIFPLHDYFSVIDNKNCDFYGITESQNWGGHKKHIQSYFIGIKRSIFTKKIFWNFFKNLPPITTYADLVKKCEVKFSTVMYENNFTSFSLYNGEKINYCKNIDLIEQLAFNALPYLIRNYKIPFIKIKGFSSGLLGISKHYNKIFDIYKMISFMKSSYPVELITNHLRRTKPLSWQKNIPNTLEVLETKGSIPQNLCNPKICVIAHLQYDDKIDYNICKLTNIPYKFDLLITSHNNNILRGIESICKSYNLKINNIIIRKNNNINNIYSYINCFNDIHLNYDYALKYKDDRLVSKIDEVEFQLKEFIERSLLYSKIYIHNIINLFKNEIKLGIVLPHYPPVFSFLNINSQPLVNNNFYFKESTEMNSYRFINAFWYRPNALNSLSDNKFDTDNFFCKYTQTNNFKLNNIDTIIPYILQSSGYYYKFVTSQEELISNFQKYEDFIQRINWSQFQINPLHQLIYAKFEEKFPRLSNALFPIAKLMWKFYIKSNKRSNK